MEILRKENVESNDYSEVERFLEMMADLGRIKLSLNSLLLRPIWREKLRTELRNAGFVDDVPHTEEQFAHWLPVFYRLSRHLQHHPDGQPMRAVAEVMGVPVSTATRFADGLVKYGLLERHADVQDRRVVLIKASQKGQQVFAVIDRALREAMVSLLSAFTPDERRLLLDLGTRLYRSWQASLEQVPHPRE